ncbi:MAG: DUF1877 family protein [Novosphingobium sp.]
MRGLHLALTSDELKVLSELSDGEQPEHIANHLEATKFDTTDACETDKSWAYIHSALTRTDPEGPLAIPEKSAATSQGLFSRLFGSRVPIGSDEIDAERYAVMGKMPLLVSEGYYIGVVPRETVGAVAKALGKISSDLLAERLHEVHDLFSAEGDPVQAANYATGWYPGLVSFYERAAEAQKHVIFTVDF